jgi:hypothetical protein
MEGRVKIGVRVCSFARTQSCSKSCYGNTCPRTHPYSPTSAAFPPHAHTMHVTLQQSIDR